MGIAGHNCYAKQNGKPVPMLFPETLVKEAQEEIGIKLEMVNSLEQFVSRLKKGTILPLGFIFEKFHYKTKKNNEFVGLGFIVTDSLEVSFTDGEVIDFKWLTPSEIFDFLESNSNYCDPLPLVFQKSETFRKNHMATGTWGLGSAIK